MLIDNPVKDERMILSDLLPFEELFKLHHEKVYALCLRMTGSPAEAEDLSQEVFVQVFHKLGTFRGESAFSTWLHRLTVNQVLMYFRKSRRRTEQLTEDGELPERIIKGRNAQTNFPILDRPVFQNGWTWRLRDHGQVHPFFTTSLLPAAFATNAE
jgi:hypothetical protein